MDEGERLAEEHINWFLETIRPLLNEWFKHGFKHGSQMKPMIVDMNRVDPSGLISMEPGKIIRKKDSIIRKGDVVVLKSGGPKMVVDAELAFDEMKCVWLTTAGNYQLKVFNKECLIKTY